MDIEGAENIVSKIVVEYFHTRLSKTCLHDSS